jgi:hypothetical protein
VWWGRGGGDGGGRESNPMTNVTADRPSSRLSYSVLQFFVCFMWVAGRRGGEICRREEGGRERVRREEGRRERVRRRRGRSL